MTRTEEFQKATDDMLDKAFAPKVEIKVAPPTRLQEHEANIRRIKAVWGPARALDELEASVTVVVAQKYEAIISQRVADSAAAEIKKQAIGLAEGERRSVRCAFSRQLEETLAHFDDANYGLARDRIGEILEELRGW
jgi:hypothetical protein